MNTSNENKMTVREAFSLAFGEVPEGATCHFYSVWTEEGGKDSGAAYICNEGVRVSNRFANAWNSHLWKRFSSEYFVSPDISDRPAESFLGFFGEAYDKVVQP